MSKTDQAPHISTRATYDEVFSAAISRVLKSKRLALKDVKLQKPRLTARSIHEEEPDSSFDEILDYGTRPVELIPDYVALAQAESLRPSTAPVGSHDTMKARIGVSFRDSGSKVSRLEAQSARGHGLRQPSSVSTLSQSLKEPIVVGSAESAAEGSAESEVTSSPAVDLRQPAPHRVHEEVKKEEDHDDGDGDGDDNDDDDDEGEGEEGEEEGEEEEEEEEEESVPVADVVSVKGSVMSSRSLRRLHTSLEEEKGDGRHTPLSPSRADAAMGLLKDLDSPRNIENLYAPLCIVSLPVDVSLIREFAKHLPLATPPPTNGDAIHNHRHSASGSAASNPGHSHESRWPSHPDSAYPGDKYSGMVRVGGSGLMSSPTKCRGSRDKGHSYESEAPSLKANQYQSGAVSATFWRPSNRLLSSSDSFADTVNLAISQRRAQTAPARRDPLARTRSGRFHSRNFKSGASGLSLSCMEAEASQIDGEPSGPIRSSAPPSHVHTAPLNLDPTLFNAPGDECTLIGSHFPPGAPLSSASHFPPGAPLSPSPASQTPSGGFGPRRGARLTSGRPTMFSSLPSSPGAAASVAVASAQATCSLFPPSAAAAAAAAALCEPASPIGRSIRSRLGVAIKQQQGLGAPHESGLSGRKQQVAYTSYATVHSPTSVIGTGRCCSSRSAARGGKHSEGGKTVTKVMINGRRVQVSAD